MKKYHLILSILFLVKGFSYAQADFPYKNPKLPLNERVKDLISRMNPEEKFWQLFMIPTNDDDAVEKYQKGILGFQVSTKSTRGDALTQTLSYKSSEDAIQLAKKINSLQKFFVENTRLGIPIIAFDEALHGLVREGATSFPQAIALAASWDTALVSKVARAIAYETKIRGIRQVLSPVVNIAADPRWGRVEETYGEDPFLASEMAVAFVSAFEKQNIVTTPKHFIANVGDGGRDSYPIHYNERLLEEIYFPPFKACIERGGSRSVMTAYNSLNGSPSSANNWLLNEKLKKEWGFKGYVISDANAVGGANVLHNTSKDYAESGQQAIHHGLDAIFQTDYDHHKLFIPSFINGVIDQQKIDSAVARVLKVKFELGLFEHPYVAETDSVSHRQMNHKALAKEAALKSIVLLKNEKNVLPFKKNIKTIAVIGTDATEARLGGYSGPGNGKVNILDGIKRRAGNTINVIYSTGCGRISEDCTTVPSMYLQSSADGKIQSGLQGDYFNNVTLAGKPVLTRIDKEVDFHWTLFSPDHTISNDFYSVRWTGKIQAPNTGKFKIGLEGNDGFRLFLDHKLIIDNWQKQTYSKRLAEFNFDKNKQYDISIEFFEPVGNAHIKLIWNAGTENDWQNKIQQAVTVSRNADIIVVAAGINEGEFQDRASLSLPGHQEELIQRLSTIGKPLIILLVGGSAITMSKWIDQVPAVLDIWYPGEEGGNAIAEVLFGDYNPAGRLPVSFPLSEAQLPFVYNHKPTGRGDDYINLSGLPLFPFGYGLSYTSFEYSGIRIDKEKIKGTDSVTVHFKIRNTGKRAGDEVAQLYIKDLLATVARPVLELKGFQRIHLLPGETKELSFVITPSLLSMLNENMKVVVEPGEFRISIGSSSRNLVLKTNLVISP